MAAIAKDGFLNRLPIIVILGATGTGKSKLALQVAKKFNGEIISADAMQVYKGLDIVTNKVTPQEQREVPHHMIDYLGPGQPINVVEFKEKALRVIEDLHHRRKVPVIAGGTYYYVEALLWNFLMDQDKPGAGEPPRKKPRLCVGGLGNLSHLVTERRDSVVTDPLEDLSADDKMRLHTALMAVDPDRASELHPNNVRKVVRSLQVVESTGKRHSELIRQQREAGGGHVAGPLKYPHSAILWITCQQDVLDGRLDARVDEMVSQGLVDELQSFHDEHNRRRMMAEEGGLRNPPYTLGIYQSIGFKEFHPYLMLEAEKREKEGQKLLKEGVTLMKMATRQYARRQIKWIRKRFLCRGVGQVPPLYALDGTNVSQWDAEVRDKAFSIVESLLEGTPCPIAAEPIVTPQPVDHRLTRCEVCDRLFEGKEQFEVHMKSMKHKKKLIRLARKEEKMSLIKASEETQTKSVADTATPSDKT